MVCVVYYVGFMRLHAGFSSGKLSFPSPPVSRKMGGLEASFDVVYELVTGSLWNRLRTALKQALEPLEPL